jgi:cytochrome c oxidase subunit II
MLNFLALESISSWFPPEASYQAYWMDKAFLGILVAAVFAFVLVIGLTLTFVIGNRGKTATEDKGVNQKARALWVLGAVALAMFAFTSNFDFFMDSTQAPYGAYEIDVTARQWDWEFTYPGGHVTDTLHVAIDRPVRLNMHTEDVVHSLLIPALRVNQAVIPGKISRTWFQADMIDTFTLRSSKYSGERYADMHTVLITHSEAVFNDWLDAAGDIFTGRTLPEVGEILYTRHGCAACHSYDGSKRVGPSFLNMYGNTFATKEGVDVVVDEAYIKESILTPNVSVIEGYDPVMTPYEGILDDREIEALTEWFKSMSDQGGN